MKPTSKLKGSKRISRDASWARYTSLSDSLIEKKLDSVPYNVVIYKDGVSACFECSLATQGSGYCQLQLNGSGYGAQQGFYLIHKLSMRKENRNPDPALTEAEVSHICHNKRCFRSTHLIWEDGKNNKKRNSCPCTHNGLNICNRIHRGPPCLLPHSLFSGEPHEYDGY